MVINYFLSVILIISPLLRASWDLWAQTVIHLITLAALLILLFSKKEISVPRPSVPLSIFLLFCFISILDSANFYESRNEFFNILNYIIIFHLAENTEKKYIVIPVLLCGIFLSFYGFYNRIAVSDEYAASLMHNSNVFAGYLAGLICLTAGFILNTYLPTGAESVNLPAGGKVYIFALIIFLLAIASAGSIAASMSVIFGISIFFYLSKINIPKKYIFFAAGIFTVLLSVKMLGAETPNRIIWWLTAVKMVLAEPVAGVGLGAFADAYSRFKPSGELNSIFAHSYFLQTAAEVGILGFAALTVFFIRIFKHACPPKPDISERSREKTQQNIPFYAAISAMLFHGIFDYALLIPANAVFFWVLLGVVSADKPDAAASSEPFSRGKETIFRWISVFLILTAVYSSVKIFLGSRETAMGKYFMDDKKLTEAETHLKKALEYDKYNPQTYFYLADIYRQYFNTTRYLTYLDEAEIELEKAAKLQKYNPQIYFELYSINYLRGDKETALLWLKKTCETAPKSIFYDQCYQIFLKEIHHKK